MERTSREDTTYFLFLKHYLSFMSEFFGAAFTFYKLGKKIYIRSHLAYRTLV